MNGETFRTLLDKQAEVADLARPDLDTLLRAGRRRRRRRAAASVVGAATAAAVVLAAVVLIPGPGGERSGEDTILDPAATPPAVITWTTGSVLHNPGGSRDLGHVVSAYVRTSEGYVLVDPEGAVWSVTGEDVEQVGRTRTDLPRLVSDPQGPRAGWVDLTGERPAFVVLDQSDGTVSTDDSHTTAGMGMLADEEDPAYFYGLEGATAYWRDDRGAVSVDLDTNVVRVVDAEAANGFDIVGVGPGLLAVDLDGQGGTSEAATPLQQGLEVVQPDGAAVSRLATYGSVAVFSPDARYVSVDADRPEVFETATGERVDVSPGRGFATGYEWLDETTLAMVAQVRGSGPQLFSCDVPGGVCTPRAELAPFDRLTDEPGGFALPVGDSLAD